MPNLKPEQLKPEQFPSTKSMARAKWAPILLAPIMGSPERFVIGVAAVGEDDFHVEQANELRRLQCLYGKAAGTAVFAAEVALDDLRIDLAERGMAALIEPAASFSGIEVGPVAEGEAPSVEQVARAWMASLSSLYDADKALTLETGELRVMASAEDSGVAERLPSLVLEYVTGHRPTLEKFFSKDIREQRQRRRRTKVHGVLIDFAGSHLVANFGTLLVSSYATSIDRVKRRMWDLKVNRDSETGSVTKRKHEMIVQHPGTDDPQVSERQYDTINEAIAGLSDQAHREEIDFQSMVNVSQIGDHLLQVELLR